MSAHPDSTSLGSSGYHSEGGVSAANAGWNSFGGIDQQHSVGGDNNAISVHPYAGGCVTGGGEIQSSRGRIFSTYGGSRRRFPRRRGYKGLDDKEEISSLKMVKHRYSRRNKKVSNKFMKHGKKKGKKSARKNSTKSSTKKGWLFF